VRTTLTIDDDIAVLVQQEVRRSGDSFKGTVNRLLRRGLTAEDKNAERAPFVVTPLFMGLRPGQNYDNIEALLEELEGPYHR
jgi:P pilus assembly chaperone PapD